MSPESHHNRIALGVGITLFALLFFAAASSLVWNFQGRFPTIQIIFIQNVVSFFCILPLALRKGWERMKTNELPTHLMRDFFGLSSYYLFFLAIRFLNLVDATTLNYTAPFFVPLIWWVWMKEKFDPHIWWSIVVGFIGVAVILNPSKDIFQMGFVFGIFAGITSAISLVSVRVLNLKREPMSRTLFYFFSISALLSFPFAWASWIPPTGYEWILCCLIGVATAIGQILLTIAYRYGTASYLSPLGYAVVIYNGLISYFIFNKSLGWRSFVGTVLIIAGGTLTYLWKKKPHSIKESFESPKPGEKPPL
jgi:drug/metabolite transporter (DMT)-like permease